MGKSNNFLSGFLRKLQKKTTPSPAKPHEEENNEKVVAEFTEEEKLKLHQILTDNASDDSQIESDLSLLAQITKEIRSIRHQEITLVGEKIESAREILQTYGHKTLKQWMELAFGSFKTAYNYLAFYRLYNSLPKPDVKEKLKQMPQKAAYILASRDGDIEKKQNIIENCFDRRTKDVIHFIQEELPPERKPTKKNILDNLLKDIEKQVSLLSRRKALLEGKQQTRVRHLVAKLEKMLEKQEQNV